MRAVVCRHFGGLDSLEVVDVGEPTAGPGTVAVEVEACAISVPDLLMLRDAYQYKPSLPFVPGGEVAGVVVEAGPGVDRFRLGDRVLGTTELVGGLAERAVLRAESCIVLPDDVRPEDAAGLLYGYGTSHYALKDRGRLRAGEILLVLGAGGAVGLAAVELGKLMGARVIAAASSEAKLAVCRSYGADETVNYVEQDLKTEVRRLTGGAGADVVYDPVGGRYSEPALRATAWDGRFLVVGFAAGDIPRIALNIPLLRGCRVVGVFLGASIGRDPRSHRANMAELVEWWRRGRLHPRTSAVHPLHRAVDAFRDLEGRRNIGKVVVTP